MVNRKAVIIVGIAAITISIPVTLFLLVQAQGQPCGKSIHEYCTAHGYEPCAPGDPLKPREAAHVAVDDSVAVSGSNIYAAWNCYNHVLFAKSNDGGKTFANTMLMSTSATNPKQYVMNDNISISASGNTVAIMWDSNKTGIVNPVIRTSNDGGNTFSNIVTLNSTSGGINK